MTRALVLACAALALCGGRLHASPPDSPQLGLTAARADLLVGEPALLTVTAVVPGASLPAGSLVQANLSTPGEVRIAVAPVTPLGAGAAELVRLVAQVPATAPYRATHILDITTITVNEGAIPVLADDALHVAAYFGDATGNGTYSALDGQRVLRVGMGQAQLPQPK